MLAWYADTSLAGHKKDIMSPVIRFSPWLGRFRDQSKHNTQRIGPVRHQSTARDRLLVATRSAQIAIKRAVDLIAAILLLAILWPLCAAIAIAIKLDDGGPVFFRQLRLGHQGDQFEIWKFRTMVPDADRFLDESGEATVDRITRVGRVLRYFSLDELPQLVNIVRGDMSMIGPRPALVSHLDRYTDEQRRRFEMRPGVTGLAQVNGRNTLAWSKRIQYDIQYIDNYSLWLDLKILALTMKVVVTREGIVLDRNATEVDDLRR